MWCFASLFCFPVALCFHSPLQIRREELRQSLGRRDEDYEQMRAMLEEARAAFRKQLSDLEVRAPSYA
jgi:hypothetical protein